MMMMIRTTHRRINGLLAVYGWRLTSSSRLASTTSAGRRPSQPTHQCQLLIVGGGSGGIGAAAMLAGRLATTVVDPADFHYYQPYFTLVGGGLATLDKTRQPMQKVMPSNAQWIKEAVQSFDPAQNSVVTDSGKIIKYDVLIVALGIQPDFGKIPGLIEGLKTPYVGSNYTPETVNKTFEALQNFRKGNAVFTFPSTPIKCPGAPQKIAYLADEYFRRNGKRENARIIYNTAGKVLFGVKKYADALWQVAKDKGIEVNLQHNLVEVIPDKRQAIFETGDDKARVTTDYEMLHVGPPMFPPKAVSESVLSDSSGYVDIDKWTLQHTRFPNVFAIGDCTTCLPKTAAAVAASLGVLAENVIEFSSGKKLTGHYNGYTSCPLTTGFNKCILAEFDGFSMEPMETFPVNQAKERKSMFFMKRDVIPFIYWKLFVKGKWTGPSTLRRWLRFSQ